MKNRNFLLLAFGFILISFAFIVIADDVSEPSLISDNDEDIDLSSDELLSSDETEIVLESEDDDSDDDFEEELEEIDLPEDVEEAERRALFQITRVTVGEGFVITDDESNAEFFRGSWVVKRLVERENDLDVENVDFASIVTKRYGNIVVGLSDSKEKFKIEIRNSSDVNESNILFDVLDNSGEIVGSLDLIQKKYSRVTLWFGDLTLNSGNYVGTWSVTAVSKTKLIKPEIERPSRWNIFALKERREVEIKEKVQEKLLEKEGFEDYAREIRGKKAEEIMKIKREIVIDREERARELIKTRAEELSEEERERIKERAEEKFKEGEIKIRERIETELKDGEIKVIEKVENKLNSS